MTRNDAPGARECCRRPMTTIQVTQPLSEGSATLTLHTCSACGAHVWERDGVRLDRGELLGAVRDRLAEGPLPRAPRVPRPRSERPTRPVSVTLPDAGPTVPSAASSASSGSAASAASGASTASAASRLLTPELEARLAQFVPHGS